MKAFALATVTLATLVTSNGGDGKMQIKRNEEGKLVQQMQIEAPNLSEEDQYGYVMPDMYRCDSCKAVVFHLNQALKKHQMKNRRMHDWEYLEVFEETCNGAFEGYGVKLINGKNTLSGPGLKQPEIPKTGGAFIQMGGQGWSNRLSEMCRTIVYDKVGEDQLYERFYSDHKIDETMCFKEIDQCSSTGSQFQKAKLDKKKGKVKGSSAVATGKSKKVSAVEVSAIAKQKSPDLAAAEVKFDGSATAANKTGQQKVETMDAKSFLESLAMEDGLDIHAYSSRRSRQEWEQLLVSMAGKIFSRQV